MRTALLYKPTDGHVSVPGGGLFPTEQGLPRGFPGICATKPMRTMSLLLLVVISVGCGASRNTSLLTPYSLTISPASVSGLLAASEESLAGKKACVKCGKLLPEDVAFCPNCGYRFSVTPGGGPTTVTYRKEPGVAWGLSFLLGFGIGHFYADNPGSGACFAIAELLSLSLLVSEDVDTSSTGATLFLLAWIADWATAGLSAQGYNQKHGLTAGPTLMPQPNGKTEIGIRLAYHF